MFYIFYSIPSADVIITFAILIEGIIVKLFIVNFNFDANVYKNNESLILLMIKVIFFL
jgi:hypothetical protein